MTDDKVTIAGEALTEQVQKSWSQFIDDMMSATDQDKLLTLLAKHVRDPEMRRMLSGFIRILFLKRKQLARNRAEILLGEFYVRLVDAVAQSYDRLSPIVFPALQSASNSQIIKAPTKTILDALYGP